MKLETNCQTGETRLLALTQEELDDAAAAKAAEDASNAVIRAQQVAEERRRRALDALLDELLAKRAAEPDAPQAIKDWRP